MEWICNPHLAHVFNWSHLTANVLYAHWPYQILPWEVRAYSFQAYRSPCLALQLSERRPIFTKRFAVCVPTLSIQWHRDCSFSVCATQWWFVTSFMSVISLTVLEEKHLTQLLQTPGWINPRIPLGEVKCIYMIQCTEMSSVMWSSRPWYKLIVRCLWHKWVYS